MPADTILSKLARYEALFQLAGKMNALADVGLIGTAFASGLKYVTDIYSWRYLGITDQVDDSPPGNASLLVIDGYVGKAIVSSVAPSSVSEFEQGLLQSQRPLSLEGHKLAVVQQSLATQFQHPDIAQVYSYPEFGDDKLQGIFLCSSREVPFDNLDLTFISLAAVLLHGKIRQIRIERRLVKGLEEKLAALRCIRRMEDQLRVQEKMASLGNLVSAVAHEINSPLGALKSGRDTLTRAMQRLGEEVDRALPQEDRTAVSIRSIVDVMEDAQRSTAAGIDRMNTIVQKLLNFVRLDQAEFQMAELREGIESVIALLREQIAGRITIVWSGVELDPLYCSPGRLNQVFMSVVENAVKSIDGQGVIEIVTSQNENDVFVEINDTGRGMPPEAVERIFDVGLQESGSRVQMRFGLALDYKDYKIVEQHGGSMEVESEVGAGTSATIRLPKAKTHG